MAAVLPFKVSYTRTEGGFVLESVNHHPVSPSDSGPFVNALDLHDKANWISEKHPLVHSETTVPVVFDDPLFEKLRRAASRFNQTVEQYCEILVREHLEHTGEDRKRY